MTNIKISFIGSGAVASSTAFISGINKICNEIVLLDINEDFAKGKAIDLQQSFILNGKNISVIGCNDYSKIKGCLAKADSLIFRIEYCRVWS